MADIFLSYKSDDLPRVRPVIDALEQRGFSVWWDRQIPPGKTYPQVIKENLNAASVVVVVWSEQSVQSEWVQIEATKGKRRGVLVPVMIDPIDDDIPLEFSLTEAADLADWDGVSPHHELEALFGSVQDILSVATGIASDAEAEQVAPHTTVREGRRPTGTPRIYISYRREDAPAAAGRLYDILVARFSRESVFVDDVIEDNRVDFEDAIETWIGPSSAVIVVIGPQWLTVEDAPGKRRLDDPRDFVRRELAAAFKKEILVIPVLVEDSRMPSSDELPSDVRALARLNALVLSDAGWRPGVDMLIDALEREMSGYSPHRQS